MATDCALNLIQNLRNACQPQHEALHVHPLLQPLNGADITLVDYQWILRGFYRAYRAMETARNGFVSVGLPDAPVLDWLDADMRRQRLAASEETVDCYPPFEEPADLIGYLYVKQGSSLGGQVISKHLSNRLGLKPELDNHFFAGYGRETGVRWKQFMAGLDALPQDYAVERVVLRAQASFDFVAKCMDEMLEMRAHAQAA